MTLTIDMANLLSQIRLLRAREFFQYADGFALVMPYYELGNQDSVNASEHFDLAKKKKLHVKYSMAYMIFTDYSAYIEI